ncbi:sugar-binding transcriptional regulator [Rhizobium sp. P38BS-XIX]|uniref:sugar-binding transcriptional regulator n=1 Tax=Rhizobium sp. P38BS-XIX TaxID=2726740 RepID=UPI0014570B86|nr:sugar-binding transcriptional regulator [Rhizobium sp. P38BS-XIX]NLR97167.1 sugar-binding transcriptional regulator [Rhizobium sp. P38BS-XIX]
MSDRNPYSARLPINEQRDHLMIQVAKLYYDLDRTQAQIASELGLTRWQVGRLLTEAKETGVVRIEITPRAGRRTSLEVELHRRFGVREAIVVPTGEIDDQTLIIDSVAQAAATHLASLSPKPALMGVSWGRTMAAVARALPKDWCPGLNVVMVNGSTALTTTTSRNSAVAEEFAQSAGGRAILLPVPAILGSRSTRDALEQDPIISRVMQLAEEAPVICFGMGGLSHQSVLLGSGYLDENDIAVLRDLNSVGDIMGRFVDAKGRIADRNLDDRTIGLRLEALSRKERVIGVAAGEDKHLIAAAGLRAGYVTDLVTDEGTALRILEETA